MRGGCHNTRWLPSRQGLSVSIPATIIHVGRRTDRHSFAVRKSKSWAMGPSVLGVVHQPPNETVRAFLFRIRDVPWDSDVHRLRPLNALGQYRGRLPPDGPGRTCIVLSALHFLMTGDANEM